VKANCLVQKACFFLFFFVLLFYYPKTAFSAHSCGQACTSGSCNVGLTCSGGHCRNPACLTQADCACDPYTIQGYKQKLNSLGQYSRPTPFSTQVMTLDNGAQTTSTNAYFFRDFNGAQNHKVDAATMPGTSLGYTVCYNRIACHGPDGIAATPGSSYTADSNRADSENNPAGVHWVDLWWVYKPLTPNCTSINASASVLIGDEIKISAVYSNASADLTQAKMFVHPNNCSSPQDLGAYTAGPTFTFDWTPSATGTYTAYCQAIAASANCVGDCADVPPQFSCDGSDGAGAGTKTTITVSNPGPWYKLKNASFHKFGNIDSVVSQTVVAVDSDDSTVRNIIIGNSGVSSTTGNYSTGPSYNPIKLSSNNWNTTGYAFSEFYLSNFIDYIRSRKESTTITADSLDQIADSSINEISGDLTLNSGSLSGVTGNNFVLLVTGNVRIDGNFNNPITKTLAIYATGTITFSDTTQNANGIFIGNQIVIEGKTPAGTDTFGLKIKGNAVSRRAYENNRNLTVNSKPAFFVVVDPDQYLSLLPLLSISKYEQR